MFEGKKVLDMKSLAGRVAVVGALALAAPVWAQQAQPANPTPHLYNPATPGANIGGPPAVPPASSAPPPGPAANPALHLYNPATPGANIGGPSGALPASSAAPGPAVNPAPHLYNPATPGANIGGPPASLGTIPVHDAVRHAHAMHAHHMAMAGKEAARGDTTAALNREESARIQAGNLSNPAAPRPPASPPSQ
jgi:hypothetical protein